MKTQLTIKNYRCFVQPVTIDISTGFTGFVGVNNAGKSTIMRFLLEFRPLFQLIGNTGNFHNTFFRNSQQISPIEVLDQEEVFSNLNSDNIEFWFDFHYEEGEKNETSPSKVLFTLDRNFYWRTQIYIEDELIPIHQGNFDVQDTMLVWQPSPRRAVDLSEIFRLGRVLSNTLYVGPFRNTINIGTRTNYLDIQIGEAFIKQFRNLKTGNTKKSNAAINRLTEEIKEIFSFNTLDISPADGDESLHITVNNQPFKQHELGSGLSQFIIVLANASIKRPAYILIDEPELNLHPSLQLDFLTTLGSYASEGVWFSTHSIGLARSSAEKVYSVQKVKDGDSIVRHLSETPRLSEFLGEMSFSSHKELGFEKLLLVEGPTEVKTIQQFLRKMSKDKEIVLLPLYGRFNDDMAEELEELLRITTSISAMIDSERKIAGEPLEANRQAFTELCRDKGIPCKVLDKRATENYFPDNVVKQVFGNEYRALSDFERLKDVEPHWGKNQNWKLAQAMTKEEITSTDLGEFLNTL